MSDKTNVPIVNKDYGSRFYQIAVPGAFASEYIIHEDENVIFWKFISEIVNLTKFSQHSASKQ